MEVLKGPQGTLYGRTARFPVR
ncbi:hypothetical protein [Qipengyuania flava]